MTEANYDRLRKSLEEALAHARGEVTGVRVAEVEIPTVDVRAKLGISQDKMAAFLGVSPSGLRKWEQGQRRPRGAALTLLRIADAEPEAVLRALRAAYSRRGAQSTNHWCRGSAICGGIAAMCQPIAPAADSGQLSPVMRLKSAIWVGAYLRRCAVEGIPAVVVDRGAAEAGAIFVKVNHLDGTARVLGPAPMAAFDEDHPAERLWMLCTGAEPVSEADADAFLERQKRYDSDLWILEIEARDGRHMVDRVVA